MRLASVARRQGRSPQRCFRSVLQCVNLCIMVIAAMINFEILDVSSKERFREALADPSSYTTDGEGIRIISVCWKKSGVKVDGLIVHPPNAPPYPPFLTPRPECFFSPLGADEYNPYGEDGKPRNFDTDGIINLPRRFLHWWHITEYDTRFRELIMAFSYTLPVFIVNLALTSVVKFFDYPAVPPRHD